MGAAGSRHPGDKGKGFELDVSCDHQGGINSMCLSEDGTILCTGSDDRTARLWTTRTDRMECIGILEGHTDYINCVLIEDGYAVTGSADKTLRKWDMGTCQCVAVFSGHKSLINKVISTGDFIFSSSYDRTTRCWDFDTGQCVRVFVGHKSGVYPLIFIPADDERYAGGVSELGDNKDILVSGSADHTAIAWSFEKARPIHIFKEHTGAITCMATDESGRILLTGSTDHSVRSWNIAKGQRLHVFEGHQSSVVCMTVINRILYTGSSDHTARSWVLEFGDCTRVYRGHEHTVGCIKYTDGIVYTGCGDGVARCFDAKSGSLQRTFKGHVSSVNCLQIVDRKLYSGSHDGTLRSWDISGFRDNTTFGKDYVINEEIQREKERLKAEQAKHGGGWSEDVGVSNKNPGMALEDENMNVGQGMDESYYYQQHYNQQYATHVM